ncbi:MAG: monovalent cation/H(+) antiporter subunit G [Geminicoccaceae bacterium]
MTVLLDILTALFIIPGCVLLLIGGYGMIRLTDVFERMHAAGLIDTLGLTLVMVGLMFQGGFTLITFKLFLVIAFVLFTSPVVTHALARAALVANVVPKARRLAPDELMQDGATIDTGNVEITDGGQTGPGGAPSNS